MVIRAGSNRDPRVKDHPWKIQTITIRQNQQVTIPVPFHNGNQNQLPRSTTPHFVSST